MTVFIAAFFVILSLLSALTLYCACRMAAISDKQDEALLRAWLAEHPEKEMTE